MTPRGFLTSLIYAAMIMTLHCKAVLLLRPPTGLSHEWLDKFTLRLFWKKPEGLQNISEPKFMVMENNKDEVCVGGTNYTKSLLTEKTDSDWTYSIWTLDKCCTDCRKFKEVSKGHTPAIITIKPPKPRAKLVKDFRCFYDPKILSCSWIPVNPSLNLTLSYRIIGELEECIKSLKQCDQPYSLGKKNGCDLHIDPSSDNIFILVETEAGMSTFKPLLVVRPPELNIIEEGDSLYVNLTPPKVGAAVCWEYEVCYKQCMVMETCQNTTGRNSTIKVPYDKHCLYEFKAKVRNVKSCRELFSDFSEAVPYGKNEPPDRTLTVVAIVIPIILSICVILSCYCLRRHSTIICPTIPDPSTIFKEMMMNGPKDSKTGQNLYMPVPERLEPCRVILVPENCVLQQNS